MSRLLQLGQVDVESLLGPVLRTRFTRFTRVHDEARSGVRAGNISEGRGSLLRQIYKCAKSACTHRACRLKVGFPRPGSGVMGWHRGRIQSTYAGDNAHNAPFAAGLRLFRPTLGNVAPVQTQPPETQKTPAKHDAHERASLELCDRVRVPHWQPAVGLEVWEMLQGRGRRCRGQGPVQHEGGGCCCPAGYRCNSPGSSKRLQGRSANSWNVDQTASRRTYEQTARVQNDTILPALYHTTVRGDPLPTLSREAPFPSARPVLSSRRRPKDAGCSCPMPTVPPGRVDQAVCSPGCRDTIHLLRKAGSAGYAPR